jgi:two-component system LytT family sensor kinase
MVETAPGAGMNVTLRVTKYAPGVRPNLPDYTAQADVPPQGIRGGGQPPARTPAHGRPA